MHGCRYTEEQDEWFMENGPRMNWRHAALTEAFNREFGDDRSVQGIKAHLVAICAHCNRYTDEEDRWLMEHRYMDRESLTRAFNRRFWPTRTKGSIKYRCEKIGAFRNPECCGSRESRMWPKEADEWLKGNAIRFRGRSRDLTVELNHRFGTRFTVHSVQVRCCRLGVTLKWYSEEEDAWLVEHRCTARKELTEMFNAKFFSNRTVGSIQAHMTRLKAPNTEAVKKRKTTG